MEIQRIVEALGLKLETPINSEKTHVSRVYASDCMSDILDHVDDTTLLVTNLSHAALVRVVELMDLPAICLLNGVEPEETMVSSAARHGATVMVASEPMFETCGRLYNLLGGNPA